MDENEPRVLGEPQALPDDVWQGAISEALSRPLDESLADLVSWDEGPALDEGLDTGWDDPAYGNDGWQDGELSSLAEYDGDAHSGGPDSDEHTGALDDGSGWAEADGLDEHGVDLEHDDLTGEVGDSLTHEATDSWYPDAATGDGLTSDALPSDTGTDDDGFDS